MYWRSPRVQLGAASMLWSMRGNRDSKTDIPVGGIAYWIKTQIVKKEKIGDNILRLKRK